MARGRNDSRQAGSGLRGGTSILTAELDDPMMEGMDLDPYPFVSPELLDLEDQAAAGRVISTQAGELVAGELNGDQAISALGVEGLDGVRSVIDESGRLVVLFADGHTASVEGGTATCDCPNMPCAHRIAAIYHSLSRDPASDSDVLVRLNAAMSAYEANPTDPELLVAAAAAGREALATRAGYNMEAEGEVLTPTEERVRELAAQLRGDGLGLSPAEEALYPNAGVAAREAMRYSADDYDAEDLRAALERTASRMGDEGFVEALAKAETKDELQKLWDSIPEDERPGGASPITLAVRHKAARVLGLPIPERDPYFSWDTRLFNYNSLIRNSLDMGRYGMSFYGPPGTGKNSYINEVASALGMPVYEVNFNAGDDLEELIGKTGLDKDGTKVELGPVTRAATAKGGAMIVFNEIVEAPRGQLTSIHDMVGSGFGGKRWITIKSSSGEKFRYEVDKDTIFALTFNPDRADRRPHAALAERCLGLGFEYGSEESEAHRVASRVVATIGDVMEWEFDPSKTDGDGERVGIEKQLPTLVDEVLKDVRCFRKLRMMYHEDQLQHYPGTRSVVGFTCQRLLEQKPADSNEEDDSAALAAMTLDFMFDQGEAPEKRWEDLVRIFADQYPEIQDTHGIS